MTRMVYVTPFADKSYTFTNIFVFRLPQAISFFVLLHTILWSQDQG